jgi:hypothetical protein
MTPSCSEKTGIFATKNVGKLSYFIAETSAIERALTLRLSLIVQRKRKSNRFENEKLSALKEIALCYFNSNFAVKSAGFIQPLASAA